MLKIAFFVEGLTEQIFVEKLLIEILGHNNLSIQKRKITGGRKTPISIVQIGSPQLNSSASYYFAIYDCSGDSSIPSYIRATRSNLIKNKFKKVFGILDVRPKYKRNEIEKLKTGLYYNLPQKTLKTKFILSIMEIEAWFLAEENHFKKIDISLTSELIINKFGYDLSTYNTELFDEPACLLNSIYSLVGKRYTKKSSRISRTVESLDYANLYINVRGRNKSFSNLLEELEFINN